MTQTRTTQQAPERLESPYTYQVVAGSTAVINAEAVGNGCCSHLRINYRCLGARTNVKEVNWVSPVPLRIVVQM